jgi:hypothetical protein
MSDTNAFTPVDKTVAITSANGTTTSVQVPSATNAKTYLLQNIGAVTMWVALGATSAITAAQPVNGTPANAFPVQAGGTLIMNGPPNAFVSTVSTATTSTLYVTPCEGSSH